MAVVPYSLKDSPALIEKLFPAQKLSVESYKEQMAGSGKTLTALGSYWKGRKPLILNRACILGCLLPATDEPIKDLEIFEKLMAMDEAALWHRLQEKNAKIPEYFASQRTEGSEGLAYKDWVDASARPEVCGDDLYANIWSEVNEHLGTEASSFPQLVEQLGIMRFGRRPKLADLFCGSGQIPFEAARLGCDTYASDLNPIACMLTWGAFNIVGAPPEERSKMEQAQCELTRKVQDEIDSLGIEEDGKGWRAKAFVYCVEVKCPESGWKVPLIPNLVLSEDYQAVASLVPCEETKSYTIIIKTGVSEAEMTQSRKGTVRQDGILICSM